MKTGSFLLALAATVLLVASAPAIAQNYKVSAKIAHDGVTVGEPIIVVKHGAPAEVLVRGETGYKMEVTVTGEAPDELQVATQLRTQRGSLRSAVTVKPGEPVRVSTGGLDLTLTVTPGSS
jgi:hypothetical protein